MTDREPTAPGGPLPHPRGARAARGPHETTTAHPELAHRGDVQPMSLTLAPRPPVRAPATDDSPADPVRNLLARLLAHGAEPPAFAALPNDPPLDLSPAESHAARRAAACPDVFVVHAPDAGVRERVAAAVARLGTATGRCLVLSPNPAAADRIAERLARHDAGVARALADDENPARPSPIASKLTSAALGAAHADALRRDAASAVTAADARLTALEHLASVAASVPPIEAEVASLVTLRDAVADAVRSEADTPFAQKLAALRAANEQHAARLAAEVAALTQSRAEKEPALAAVRQQHAELTAPSAKKTGLLGRLFGGKNGPDPAELEKQIQALEADLAAIAAGVAERQARLASAANTHAAEVESTIEAEVAARRAELDAKIIERTAAAERARTEAWAAAAPLGVTALGADDLKAAQYAATLALVEAKERAAEAARSSQDAARRHLSRVPVVVGTPGSVHVDPVFARDPATDGAAPFALLVLDQAEELGEHDFVQLAKLATRWVLIGDAAQHDEPKPAHNGTGPRRNGRPVETPFAVRLARALDRETWVTERDRLVCRLARLTHEQRRTLFREPLIDRPEVELRFLDAGDEPLLAEVAFPLAADVAGAKAFLFAELGEVLLRPLGAVRWDETPTGVAAVWPDADRPDGVWIDLEPGVRERVCGIGCGAFTAAVTFDASAGWDAGRAAEWLAGRAAHESSARYASVPRSPRG